MELNFILITIGLMLLGNITHIVKKVVEVRQTDGEFSILKYLSMYPYKTFLIVMAGVGGYLGLLSAGELTYVSAFMVGFVANSLGGIDASKAKVA
ncbi:MAG: hypothetical protein QNJ81_02600 [Acidimicrobiia bacterium]|nr:hypothetical protein [Acidimicrobiia bacterium]